MAKTFIIGPEVILTNIAARLVLNIHVSHNYTEKSLKAYFLESGQFPPTLGGIMGSTNLWCDNESNQRLYWSDSNMG